MPVVIFIRWGERRDNAGHGINIGIRTRKGCEQRLDNLPGMGWGAGQFSNIRRRLEIALVIRNCWCNK